MSPSETKPVPVHFQLASDLHMQTSYGKYDYHIPKRAKYLLLPGDIGAVGRTDNVSSSSRKPRHHAQLFLEFLARQCSQFERVFLVAGNHEYKQNTIAHGDATLKGFETHASMHGRLTVLEKDRFDLRDEGNGNGKGILLTVLGCALWSRLREDQPEAADNDMERVDGRGIVGNSREAHNARFEDSLGWIQEEVGKVRREDPKRRILVMTHHAPKIRWTSELRYDQKGSYWSAYQNDILGGEGVDGLQEGDVWVYGHTHWSTTWIQDEVRGIANQRGGSREEGRGIRRNR
ncbi:hypothetical protein EG329_013648 [Mollisiaceae sp. DMI_Dod_QoI]|nr:hypothetical protein EG329_013648 [Helotiales sp. DMI_Dod_QoI]